MKSKTVYFIAVYIFTSFFMCPTAHAAIDTSILNYSYALYTDEDSSADTTIYPATFSFSTDESNAGYDSDTTGITLYINEDSDRWAYETTSDGVTTMWKVEYSSDEDALTYIAINESTSAVIYYTISPIEDWSTLMVDFHATDGSLSDIFFTYSGTVSATPIPGSIWLLGVGLLGFVLLRRRNGTPLKFAFPLRSPAPQM